MFLFYPRMLLVILSITVGGCCIQASDLTNPDGSAGDFESRSGWPTTAQEIAENLGQSIGQHIQSPVESIFGETANQVAGNFASGFADGFNNQQFTEDIGYRYPQLYPNHPLNLQSENGLNLPADPSNNYPYFPAGYQPSIQYPTTHPINDHQQSAPFNPLQQGLLPHGNPPFVNPNPQGSWQAQSIGENRIASCEQHVTRLTSTLPPGLMGAYIPQCSADGMYEQVQFHGSTGYSWCVDRFTGIEIPFTRVAPGRGPPPCLIQGSWQAQSIGSGHSAPPTQQLIPGQPFIGGGMGGSSVFPNPAAGFSLPAAIPLLPGNDIGLPGGNMLTNKAALYCAHCSQGGTNNNPAVTNPFSGHEFGPVGVNLAALLSAHGAMNPMNYPKVPHPGTVGMGMHSGPNGFPYSEPNSAAAFHGFSGGSFPSPSRYPFENPFMQMGWPMPFARPPMMNPMFSGFSGGSNFQLPFGRPMYPSR